jgi:hypothetical protein
MSPIRWDGYGNSTSSLLGRRSEALDVEMMLNDDGKKE